MTKVWKLEVIGRAEVHSHVEQEAKKVRVSYSRPVEAQSAKLVAS